MGFSKVSSEDPKAKLLYLSDYEGITITDKIAYVLNVKDGLANNQKGFYGFTLKTADCKTIYAVIFDVPKFLESGLKAQGLKNCFVKISSLHFIKTEAGEGKISSELMIVERASHVSKRARNDKKYGKIFSGDLFIFVIKIIFW